MTARHRKNPSKQKPFLWQRHNEVVKDKGVKKRFVWGIFLGLAVALVLVSGYVYRMLTSGVWVSSQRLNFVVGREGEALAVVSVPPEGSVLVFYLDPQVMVDTVYGYGEYKVGALLKLGKIEKRGSALMKGSLQQTLGIPLHDVVSASVPDQSAVDLRFLQSLVRPMTLSLIGHPLSVVDVYRYFNTLSRLRADEVTVVPIHESRFAYTQTLPDDSVVYRLDKERLDGYLQNQMNGQFVGEEDFGVAIVNTTNHAGLASSLSRILLNSGMDVVSLGENQERLDKTVLVIGSEEDRKADSVTFVSNLLGVSPRIGQVSDYRARMVVLLGEDYYLSR